MFYIGFDIGGTKCAASLGKITVEAENPKIMKNTHIQAMVEEELF